MAKKKLLSSDDASKPTNLVNEGQGPSQGEAVVGNANSSSSPNQQQQQQGAGTANAQLRPASEAHDASSPAATGAATEEIPSGDQQHHDQPPPAYDEVISNLESETRPLLDNTSRTRANTSGNNPAISNLQQNEHHRPASTTPYVGHRRSNNTGGAGASTHRSNSVASGGSSIDSLNSILVGLDYDQTTHGYTSCDVALNTDPDLLYKFVTSLNSRPTVTAVVTGYMYRDATPDPFPIPDPNQTQYNTTNTNSSHHDRLEQCNRIFNTNGNRCGGSGSGGQIQDFKFSLDLTPFINPNGSQLYSTTTTSRNNNNSKRPSIGRNSILQYQQQQQQHHHPGSSPSALEEQETMSLLLDYTNSESTIKQLHVQKRVIWDYERARKAIKQAVVECGYPHYVKVEFPMSQDQIKVYSNTIWGRMWFSGFLTFLLIISIVEERNLRTGP
ncbi:hypothetical protein H4219_004610 [Mycoemilia scoparia]|uniref:Uncharacterized protein n=1 Tax=Mycoemilia scoparia TaxID=417184 RepID=A0A9W8DR29_9FUNG|nr:hypothetical protein H4219_004610 [Mycoemilia scoparia]